MWNFFARESFPYESVDRVVSFSGLSVFSLNDGVKKGTGEKVSIFTYNKKSGNQELLEHARSAVKRLKTLKHPAILTYLHSYEDENVIHIVTNRCTPLLVYLKTLGTEESGEMYLKWGLATIGEAVAFLNHADLRHNNIFHGSVFVNDHGCWQLGDVGYITPLKSSYPYKLTEAIRKYNPPEEMLKSSVWTIDNWGLGLLLWETFNDELDSIRSLAKPKKIPSELSKSFNQLLHHKEPSDQDIVESFIKSCTCTNALFNNLDALSNYHLKDMPIKGKISKDLLGLLPMIPKDIVVNKIFSLLKQAHGFDSESSAYFVPIVAKMPSLATEEKLKNEIEQFLVLLFSSNDRATRLSLLMNIEEFINIISKKSVNDLFPYFSAGFLDSNPKIRGETVKAMVFIAPHLSKKNLNDEGMRLLLQIQGKDSEAHIRTNATICLGKIAYSLQPNTRKKVLLNAFLYALRDSCPSVRNAGIQAFAVTHRFFPIEETAKNILPGLTCLTVDLDSNVRENTFKTIKILLSKLEQVSKSPEAKEVIEKDVMSETCEDNVTWSGWAISALTSKFLKPTETKMKAADSTENKKTDTLENKKSDTIVDNKKPPETMVNELKQDKEKSTETPLSADPNSGDSEASDYDGWGDSNCEGWDDISEVLPTKKIVTDKTQENAPRRNTGPMKLGTRLQK
ncbi:N-terminal kinase-like protein [Halyomorpha halys]|uniref:N-terminal kinase-like protein n=1 Tax=Halyomorpha halys TaxID=286706 RepID=UPI0006D4D746|nr:N-terminal kinase-like protein [Halyomorpha halys]